MADIQLYSNFFETSLASGITDTATTITVVSGSGMNSPGASEYEMLAITDGSSYELVKCTARSINTLTVVRAQEGTSGVAFSSGAKVYAPVTANTLSGFTKTESFIVAVTGENTNIDVGTGIVTFRMPYALSLTAVKADTSTIPTGSVTIIDINESGSTILSTRLYIDDGEDTSVTSTTQAVISDTELADNAKISIDVDAAASTNRGRGLKVTFIGYRV